MNYGYLAAIGSYVLWGLLPIFWKLLEELSPVYILSARIVYSLVFCILLVSFTKRWPDIKKEFQQPKRMARIALAGILITINWGTYIAAVNGGHILDASLGYYMNPLVSVLFGVVFFREKLNTWEGAAIMIAAVGVMIMIIQYGSVPWIALILAITFAAYGAVKKTLDLDTITSLTMETACVFPIFLIYLFHMEAAGEGAVAMGLPMVLLAMSSGIVTAAPLLLYGAAVRLIPFTILGFVQYISPTLELIIGLTLYGETLTVERLMTFVFIWFALVIFLGDSIYQIRSEQKRRKSREVLKNKV